MNTIDPLIRPREVMAMIGVKSRDTFDKLRKRDRSFPKPLPLTTSTARNAAIAWPLSEVQEWVERRKKLRRADPSNQDSAAA